MQRQVALQSLRRNQQHHLHLSPVNSQLRCFQQHLLDFFFLILTVSSTASVPLTSTSRFVPTPAVSIPTVSVSVTTLPLSFANSSAVTVTGGCTTTSTTLPVANPSGATVATGCTTTMSVTSIVSLATRACGASYVTDWLGMDWPSSTTLIFASANCSAATVT